MEELPFAVYIYGHKVVGQIAVVREEGSVGNI